MNQQTGLAKVLLFITLVIVLGVVGYFAFVKKPTPNSNQTTSTSTIADSKTYSNEKHLLAPEPQKIPCGSGKPCVGAIRWDAWYQGSPYVQILAPEEWHYRHPFYIKMLPNGTLESLAYSQEVMDQEIVYAANAGLDFWIFHMYISRDPQGNPIPDAVKPEWKAEDMNLARRAYLSSKHKSKLNFALMLGAYTDHNWDFQLGEALVQMQEPSYQKVLDGRPLVFLFVWGQNLDKIWGGWERGRQRMDDFRQRVQTAGMKNPYIVAMVMTAEEGKRSVEELGADAVTAYTSRTEGRAYRDLMQADQLFWESSRNAGLNVIPILSTGWDPRPHKDDIWGYGGYNGTFVDQATPAQIAEHLKAGLQWMQQYPETAEAQTSIFYAWNEHSEGGWLVPTVQEGTARLDAIKQVLQQNVTARNNTQE